MFLRHVSRRDFILVLLGAACFYTFSALSSPRKSSLLNNGLGYNEQTLTAIQTVTTTETKTAFPPVQTHVDLGLAQDFLETSLVAHAPGWTIFRNLYMANGTLLIVTSDPSQFPEPRMMTSTGLPGNLTNDAQRMPTAKEMDFVTPQEAKTRWGGGIDGRHRVSTVEGTTLLFNDPPQFLNHYFHFVAELMFGSWAFLYGAFHDQTAKPPASAEPSFNLPLISNSVPTIDRAIFIHSDVEGWRDAPGFNGYFVRAVFPSMTVEVETDWLDRIKATANTEIRRAWHFPLALLTDRSAAFRGPITGAYTQRTAAEPWMIMAKAKKIDLIGNWWASMRSALVRYAGGEVHEDLSPELQLPETVVITYINRQGTRRHLLEEDNRALIAAMEDLVERKNRIEDGPRWEFNNVHAEQLSLDEQIRFAAKTTIMLGVHGNGLTHLVLAKPNRLSAVVELFIPGGFARDYEWTSRSLGITHYSVWFNESFTHPHEPEWPDYPEGFHGPSIPVDGPFVAKLIEEHVAAREKGVLADNSPVNDQH
ncbi:hypothetical protein MSAN_00379200 [Mycena sanguinolenta]|uniref:Glycosyltransferase 61 catalytic domain-containing protein n=1 Tax=Mycena sanguinolenta TaxID=230812 RepID=A0A8H6ZER3_9AGAR|nr:hypothetical protein MSAN_00379200 [Mycena sanguinolenta]